MIQWITSMYHNRHTRQKSLKRYMKYWRSKLVRLNETFSSYIKDHYKVVDYGVRKPSLRVTDLTWRPYGYYRRIRINKARKECLRSRGLYIIEAKSSVQKRKKQLEFDTDSYDILFDNCCSHSLTNCKEDFIEPPIKSRVKVRGYNGHTESTMVGTVKWKIQDDNGKIHNFILPNTYYSSAVETRLLSPQHWAQVRNGKRDTYCVTYYDAIIMRLNKDKYQITAPLSDEEHRNVGVVRSVPGIKSYLTPCRALDQEHEVIAFPATIGASNDEELEATLNNEPQTPPVDTTMEQDMEQMREGLKEVTFQDDEQVDEESLVYADDKQEYMHWHYRLNHPTHKVMCKMANQHMLPRQITRILKAMENKHTKPPMCNDCCGAKAT